MKPKPQKIFFGSNVRFLRERMKANQEGLAAKLGFTRAKLAAIELGNTKSIPPEDYICFSELFKISIDSLIKVDLPKLGELKMRELEAGSDVYIRGGNLRVLAISVDKENNENVEYVPVKAKAGYVSGYNDPEFIAGLPRYSLPNLPKGGTFRIFPTVGDSMLPIPEGSEITGQYVTDWESIKPDTACIVILKGAQDFVFKLVSLQADGMLLLRSLNPAYEAFHVAAGDVLEIWKFHAFYSRELPDPETDIQQLIRMIRELKDDIQTRK